jgi:hypothetical protein
MVGVLIDTVAGAVSATCTSAFEGAAKDVPTKERIDKVTSVIFFIFK